jgi:hypothetical protein
MPPAVHQVVQKAEHQAMQLAAKQAKQLLVRDLLRFENTRENKAEWTRHLLCREFELETKKGAAPVVRLEFSATVNSVNRPRPLSPLTRRYRLQTFRNIQWSRTTLQNKPASR